MEIKKIYIDMDGVLADFDRGIRELCGMEPIKQTELTPESSDAIWEAVKAVEHYYDKLELVPGAKEMFDALYKKYGDRCEILSAIPKPHRGIVSAGEDKEKWIRRLLSDKVKVNIVYRAEKIKYCTGPDCVLIDDYEKNVTEWENHGGTGILFENADDVVKKIV